MGEREEKKNWFPFVEKKRKGVFFFEKKCVVKKITFPFRFLGDHRSLFLFLLFLRRTMHLGEGSKKEKSSKAKDVSGKEKKDVLHIGIPICSLAELKIFILPNDDGGPLFFMLIPWRRESFFQRGR